MCFYPGSAAYRGMQTPEHPDALLGFADQANVSSYAAKAIPNAEENGTCSIFMLHVLSHIQKASSVFCTITRFCTQIYTCKTGKESIME